MRKSLAHAFYKIDRERLLKEQNNRCYYCGKSLTRKTATMDHVVPISKTKYHSTGNCVVACYSCNNKKSNQDTYTPQDWEMQLVKGIEKLEERIKQAEFRLSFDQKGGFRKWKRYWTKRKRWQ